MRYLLLATAALDPGALLPHAASGRVGWALVLLGFLTGAALGLSFHREDFWGGYGSFRRRVARLGHIALVALGVLNLLYALFPYPRPGSGGAAVAGIGLAVGGFGMPAVCFLTAWRKPFRHLFPLPVLSLAAAAACLLVADAS